MNRSVLRMVLFGIWMLYGLIITIVAHQAVMRIPEPGNPSLNPVLGAIVGTWLPLVGGFAAYAFSPAATSETQKATREQIMISLAVTISLVILSFLFISTAVSSVPGANRSIVDQVAEACGLVGVVAGVLNIPILILTGTSPTHSAAPAAAPAPAPAGGPLQGPP